MNILFDSVSEK